MKSNCDSDSSHMIQDYASSDKYIFRASATVVVILALASAILSYSALQKLAMISGIPAVLSFLFPIVIDGLILSGTLLVLYFAVRGKRTAFGIFLTLLGVIASIAGNIAISDNNLIHQMVHGAPALVLFLSLEALTILLRSRYKEKKTALVENDTTPAPSLLAPESPETPLEEPSSLLLHDDPSEPFIELPVEEPEILVEPVDTLIMDEPVDTLEEEPVETDLIHDQYVIPSGSKREQIEYLVKRDPDIRPKTVTELLGGDRSYNSKILREVKSST